MKQLETIGRALVAVALVAGFVAAPAMADEKLAYSQFLKKNYVEAIAECEAVLQNAPTYHDCYALVGASYIQLKKYNDAVVNLRKAIDLEPGKFEYHGNLAKALFYLGKFGEVVAILNKAEPLATADQHKALLHHLRGLALAREKNWSRAITDLKAANPDRSHGIALALGGACRNAGDLPCAANAYKSAAKLKPDDARAWESLAETQLEMAVREQNKAKKEALYASSVTSAQKLVALTDSADAHKNLADAYLGAGEYRKAVGEYETVLSKEPKNCAAMLSKSQALVPLEKWSDVITWGQKAASCGGKKHLAYNQMAFGYIKLGQWDDAISAADKSLAVKKSSMAERFKTTAMQKKDVEMHNAKVAQEAAELARQRAEEERRVAEAKRREEEYRIKTGQAKAEEGEKKKKDDGDSD